MKAETEQIEDHGETTAGDAEVPEERDFTRQLSSIAAGNLAVICGAGLSIPSPSDLLSAAEVSRMCYDKHEPIEKLPPELREDVDKLAGHFYDRSEFVSVFLQDLVPWDDLSGPPNNGHAALADFLICRAIISALSANFDVLIEQWAWEKKVAMQGALTGEESVRFSKHSNPLVKFHGCMNRNREETLWTREQLTKEAVKSRMESCSTWMEQNLPGRDLLIVGFWTDWGYLNDVLSDALQAATPASVTIVDPASSEDLKKKAPILWATLESTSSRFSHVRGSGAEYLDALRVEFSKVWMRTSLALGRKLFDDSIGPCPLEFLLAPDLDADDYYDLRRDLEGVPYNRAAVMSTPDRGVAQAAFVHLLLMNRKAVRVGAWYDLDGLRIRVVQGAGESVSTVREKYEEPPAAGAADLVICVGAIETGVPGRLISSGAGDSVARPGPGGGSTWITLETATRELGL